MCTLAYIAFWVGIACSSIEGKQTLSATVNTPVRRQSMISGLGVEGVSMMQGTFVQMESVLVFHLGCQCMRHVMDVHRDCHEVPSRHPKIQPWSVSQAAFIMIEIAVERDDFNIPA